MHVSWDPDIPPLFLAAHEAVIKGWATDFLKGKCGPSLRVVPLCRSLKALSAQLYQEPIFLRLTLQRHAATRAERAVVQPLNRSNAALLRAWNKAHEGFTVEDFKLQ